MCARVKRGESSEKTPGGEMTAWKEALPVFRERGEAADGLKGYLHVNGGEGSDEERGRKAASCQVQRPLAHCRNSWSCSWQELEGAGRGAGRGAEWILALMRTSAYQSMGLEWQFKRTGAWWEIWHVVGPLSDETVTDGTKSSCKENWCFTIFPGSQNPSYNDSSEIMTQDPEGFHIKFH